MIRNHFPKRLLSAHKKWLRTSEPFFYISFFLIISETSCSEINAAGSIL